MLASSTDICQPTHTLVKIRKQNWGIPLHILILIHIELLKHLSEQKIFGGTEVAEKCKCYPPDISCKTFFFFF